MGYLTFFWGDTVKLSDVLLLLGCLTAAVSLSFLKRRLYRLSEKLIAKDNPL